MRIIVEEQLVFVGAPMHIDDTPFTPGTDQVTPIGGFVDETATDSVDEGDVGAIRMTPDRKILARLVGSTDANRLEISAAGAASVDTELPAAVALADAVANPTTPVIAAYNVAKDQNATTYSRCSGELANSDTLDHTSDRGQHVSDVVKYHETNDLDSVVTTYDDSPTSANSQDLDCSRFRKFTLYIDVGKANTPTDIQFIIQFKDDEGNYFDYRDWFWGQLLYDDTAVGSSGFSRAWTGECIAKQMRLRVVCTGTTATNTFIVNQAKIIFKN